MAENRRYASFDVGVGTYGYPEIAFYDAGAKLRIGKYCAIAPKVTILLGGEHRSQWISTYPFSLLDDAARDLPGYPYTKGDVTIGNDVWIGYDALILSGVTIGDGAVIGARSLVSKDVEPYAVVGGIPAKLIKYRFSDSIIESLIKISWWDWPPSEIRRSWHLIQSPNLHEFVSQHSTKTRDR